MRIASTEEFLTWASEKDIGLDTRFAPPQLLQFLSEQEDSRLWPSAYDLEQLLALPSAVMQSVDSWENCWVYKREGAWSYPDSVDRRALVLRSIGIPEGAAGVLWFEATELAPLLIVFMAQIAFGWNVTDDVFLVPDHGRQIVGIDHEGAVWVSFPNAASVDPFVQRMAEAGFELPTRPPDSSFAWQRWMGPQPPDWPDGERESN